MSEVNMCFIDTDSYSVSDFLMETHKTKTNTIVREPLCLFLKYKASINCHMRSEPGKMYLVISVSPPAYNEASAL